MIVKLSNPHPYSRIMGDLRIGEDFFAGGVMQRESNCMPYRGGRFGVQALSSAIASGSCREKLFD